MFAFVSTTYYGTGAWLADAFVEHGWSEARAGSLIGILNVTALGGTLLIAFAGDRIGSRRTLPRRRALARARGAAAGDPRARRRASPRRC